MWHREQVPTCTDGLLTTKRCDPLRGGKRGRGRGGTNFSRGQIDCLSRYGRIGTAIFKKCQYVVQPGVSAEEYFERKSGTDNIPAAARAETSLEALVKK